MSKSNLKEREEALSALATRMFASMLDDIIMDTVLASHHEVAKSRVLCDVCGTRCGVDHPTGAPTSIQSSLQPVVFVPSRPSTPAGDPKTATNGGTGPSTPSSGTKVDANYFECVGCERQIASNRYAPHLSSCLGIGTGTRRGAARTTNSTKRSSPAGGRSASPSDAGNVSEESASPIKTKGKSKSKRADEAEFHLKRKRNPSPQPSPSKKFKPQKNSGFTTTRIRGDADSTSAGGLAPLNAPSKLPSRLRESSTASFIASSVHSSGSRSSSESLVATPSSSGGGTLGMAGYAPAPMVITTAPPPIVKKPKGRPRKNPLPTAMVGAPQTPMSMPVTIPDGPTIPRPPPPPVRVIESEYLDVEGEETGSSTDTGSE